MLVEYVKGQLLAIIVTEKDTQCEILTKSMEGEMKVKGTGS